LIDGICSDWNQGKTNISKDYKFIYSLDGCLLYETRSTCDFDGNLQQTTHDISMLGSKSIIINDCNSEAQARAELFIHLLAQNK
jgi:hypothetical protein